MLVYNKCTLMNTNSFTVYNASAGSGKTFTLVKEYLKTLFLSDNKDKYRHVLAITFTNKAVAEMKARILESLEAFSDAQIIKETVPEKLEDAKAMFIGIATELNIPPLKLHQKAQKVHQAILSSYASFDIVTIDRFVHGVIRTFAYDLKLPQNFEVVIDTDEILQQAVSNTLLKVGEDKGITELLINYAIQKLDDDKSWDIEKEIFKTAKILLNENEIPHIAHLKNKPFSDFKELHKILNEKNKALKASIQQIAQKTMSLFYENDITVSEVRYPYGFFKKAANGELSLKFDSGWQEKLIKGIPMYPSSRVKGAMAATIDRIQPEVVNNLEEMKRHFYQLRFHENVQKNLVPLSVLSTVHKEMEQIKATQSIVLISEFNKIISDEIKQQPIPFIYERIGERYQNYFIDEFQDTSQMQWQNVIPLVENALSSAPKENEKNSLLIVGDAKQSIYRWRGGNPEQFIDLYEKENPFHITKNVENLETNYRSYSAIIDFNNSFFHN